MTEPTKRTSRKERVSWTEAELQAVIEEAVLISLEDAEHLWYYMAKAQSQVLGVDRHRRIGGKHVVTPEILARFEKARQEILNHKAHPAEVVEVPTPASTPTPPVDRAAVIGSLTNAEIFDLIVRRLSPFFTGIQAFAGVVEAHVRKPESEVKMLAPAPDGQAAPPAPTTTTQAPPTKPSPPPSKTKVLLFGFNAMEEVEIRKKSANFDLELLFVSQMPGQPVPTIPVCDWCIIKRSSLLTRRAKFALSRRPGVERQINAGTVETVLQKLNDLNSRKKAPTSWPS